MNPYQLLNNGTILRIADLATIPIDLNNQDYQNYLLWKKAGGISTPAVVVPPSRKVSATTFRNLFTESERIAVRAADPRLQDAELKAIMQDDVNLASVEISSLMALAVAKGALTQLRANAILAAPGE